MMTTSQQWKRRSRRKTHKYVKCSCYCGVLSPSAYRLPFFQLRSSNELFGPWKIAFCEITFDFSCCCAVFQDWLSLFPIFTAISVVALLPFLEAPLFSFCNLMWDPAQKDFSKMRQFWVHFFSPLDYKLQNGWQRLTWILANEIVMMTETQKEMATFHSSHCVPRISAWLSCRATREHCLLF